MFEVGQGGSAAQHAESPPRPALPRFPHDVTAYQPTPVTTEGAPSHVPVLWGTPEGEECKHGLGAMSSRGLSTDRQQGPSRSCKPLSPCSRALTKQEKGGFPHSWPPTVAPVPTIQPEQQNQVASGRYLLCRLGWEHELFAKGV